MYLMRRDESFILINVGDLEGSFAPAQRKPMTFSDRVVYGK